MTVEIQQKLSNDKFALFYYLEKLSTQCKATLITDFPIILRGPTAPFPLFTYE